MGIFPYSPIYMIFFPGIILSFIKRKRQALYLFAIFLLHWGFCSSAYYWGGYCPPGRALLPVVFIMALFMAGALAWGKNKYSFSIQRVLIFLSLGITFLCARDPKLLYHGFLSRFIILGASFSNLTHSLSNSLVNFRILVPSLISKAHIMWTPLIFWLLGFILISILYLKKEKTAPDINKSLRKPMIAVVIAAMLFVAYTFFDIHTDREYLYTNRPYKLYFQDTHNFGQELQGFWTEGQLATEVLIQTDSPVSMAIVKLSSPAPGKATVRVGRAKRAVPRGRMEDQDKTLRFASPVGFPWKRGHLYCIRVKEERGFIPYQLDPKVQDNRFLGIFVEIDVTLEKK
jgi:hypothetical protein